MRRRLWFALLVLYAVIGVVDGAIRVGALGAAGVRPVALSALPVAFCAGLFWPIDLAARLVLRG